MDEHAFRRIAGALRRFHRQFAPLFGRKETRRHGARYVRGCWRRGRSGAAPTQGFAAGDFFPHASGKQLE
jgi:hypothetical protein